MRTEWRPAREDGYAAVELLLVAPIYLFFTLVCTQFAALFFAWLSILTVARDAGRWLAVNPNTLDSAAISAVAQRVPSDLDPAKLQVTIVPGCTALSQNKCPNRAAGQDIAVTLTYDAAGLFFLPTHFTFLGGLTVQFPTQLPPYTTHMQAEPT